jgi:soluble lytic murein transglycosylase
MVRDLLRRTMNSLLHTLLFAATVACQQGERRESPGEVATALPTRPAPIPTDDADVRAAQLQLSEGRGALASKIVMPVLRVPERRTPEALLVASRAAAEWRGWSLVHAMLAHEPWLASRFGGEGLELLARSALERGEATTAREYAEAALRVPSEAAARAFRLVLLARALDRLGARDSAAASYRRAAGALPIVRDWLLLRAAGSTEDARARERLYAGVKDTAARARIAPTEAQTLERFKMLLAAADAYEKLGDMASAYRLRLESEFDSARRSSLRAGLLGYIQRDARGEDLVRALEVLDAAFPRLDETSQLLATRRAVEGGITGRVATGYARVPAAMLGDDDMIAWARALIASGRPTEAATRLSGRRFGARAAAEAQYLRGLALVRAGRATRARPVLQSVITTHRDTREAADALYLVADMENDAGRDARARDLLARSCLAKTPGVYSDEACFLSGILSFALGNMQRAASAFDELGARFPSSDEALAATYWSGRAWERAGKPDVARERWNAVMLREPLSYYGTASARRLAIAPRLPAQGQLQRSPFYQAAINRAAVLEQLGMDVEERYVYEGIESDADATPATILGAGAALLERGEVTRAIRLGWKAVAAGRGRDSAGLGDQRGYLLVYPLLREAELIARARAHNLDPALVAAIIRQESSWNPRAVSRAGARGLMQIMPSVGEEIARSRRYPVWDPAMLFDADVSLDLGTSHLKAALSQYNLPRALAAYNAGDSRVRRWVRRTGASDPEIFIERIPFVETRDYVRIVMRNVEMYRALHGLRK